MTRTAKGTLRRDQLAAAAADLVLREGPGALTHRRVAAAAGASLSATTYYFADLDELAAAAGTVLAQSWARNAASVLATLDAGPPTGADQAAAAVVAAVLPPGDDDAVRAQYEHLLGAGRNRALARAFAGGRAQVDDVVARVLAAVGLDLPPAIAVALVDGAVVSALSEDRPVRPTARDLLLAAAG
ncbi:hypothetical protein OMK64_11855 [Cellulomonas fimi]|uniref:TetR/AcrR family transcriptional regulator n=1 Tax=Cellulomonas fimi TaxID=1708 RepID=UPI00234D4080|nr:hypothetical protein [Cellulomonas fimi]MDC7122231.1 hypothetical protein [Cellulomonas fimi]